MKKIICFTIMLITIISMVTLNAEAKTVKPEKRIIVFGDSISTGYALEDYDPSDLSVANDCFVNIIAKENGLEYNKDIYNFSVVGKDSKSTLKSVKNTDKELIRDSDVIIISTGGNDVIDTYGQVMSDAAENEKELLAENGVTFDFHDLRSLENSVISTVLDPAKLSFVNKFIDVCTDENAMKRYNGIPEKYTENIKETISYIRSTGSAADIVLITPYNPMKMLPINNKIFDSISSVISRMCSNAVELENNKTYNENLHVINLLSEFDNRYAELTNITSFDIHPSSKGHKLISELIIAELSDKIAEETISPEITEQNSNTSVSDNHQITSSNKNDDSKDKNSSFSPTVTYILFAAALMCCALVIADFIIKRIRAKKSGK